MDGFSLLEKLASTHCLREEDYLELLARANDADLRLHAAALADEARRRVYGDAVFIRGLIEISSYCRNDCLYCGLRCGNKKAARYRLSAEEILSCCEKGYALGFRTFVLQGGEDGFFTDEVILPLVREIKTTHPDCAITLSLGERDFESYRALREAGADRYLLRHESADAAHYAFLHEGKRELESRLACLRNLKRLGFATGAGFMVGSPGQTLAQLAKDLVFIQSFQPEMCGIGPFIPHADTPFANEPAGSLEMTLFCLSLLRLMNPALLLPATTALGTIHPEGRELGVLAGANVVMPNLSPPDAREKYLLYNNKLNTGAESAEHLKELDDRLRAIGFHIVTDRGDPHIIGDGDF